MRVFIVLFLILHFEAAFSKVFEVCEFAEELHKRHNIPQKEIFKHFCIAGNNLDTTKSTETGYVGIYGVGSKWWCGQNEAGGGCNIKCSNLLDDDITDDVECMQVIFDNQGLFAWAKNRDQCLVHYDRKVSDCFANMCFQNCLVT